MFEIKKRKGGRNYVRYDARKIIAFARWGYVVWAYKNNTYNGIWYEWLNKRIKL